MPNKFSLSFVNRNSAVQLFKFHLFAHPVNFFLRASIEDWGLGYTVQSIWLWKVKSYEKWKKFKSESEQLRGSIQDWGLSHTAQSITLTWIVNVEKRKDCKKWKFVKSERKKFSKVNNHEKWNIVKSDSDTFLQVKQNHLLQKLDTPKIINKIFVIYEVVDWNCSKVRKLFLG